MFRIGILGSDNSHAQHFARLCNVEKVYGDDVRIVAIYGNDDDPNHTKEVAEKGEIPFIANNPEEFMGKVDAVMVVYRRGSLHVPHILPFIEAGYPVWIDKPITSSPEDIDKLIKQACIIGKSGNIIKDNYDILFSMLFQKNIEI